MKSRRKAVGKQEVFLKAPRGCDKMSLNYLTGLFPAAD